MVPSMKGETLAWAMEPLEGTGNVLPAQMKFEGKFLARLRREPAGAIIETSCPCLSSWDTILMMMLFTPPGTVQQYGETTPMRKKTPTFGMPTKYALCTLTLYPAQVKYVDARISSHPRRGNMDRSVDRTSSLG
jgi:hypothetical protein